MVTNSNDEWQRLTKHYREMGEGELLELATDIHNLTEVAKGALRDELRLRGLEMPEADSNRPPRPQLLGADRSARQAEVHLGTPDGWLGPDDVASVKRDGPAVEYSWKVFLAEFETGAEAWQLAQALSRSGIESWIDRPAPRVLVAADQLEQAQMVAKQPIPQEIIDQSEMTAPEFDAPACPSCGAGDPILEEVDPVNSWRCEICGKAWSDPPEAAI